MKVLYYTISGFHYTINYPLCHFANSITVNYYHFSL